MYSLVSVTVVHKNMNYQTLLELQQRPTQEPIHYYINQVNPIGIALMNAYDILLQYYEGRFDHVYTLQRLNEHMDVILTASPVYLHSDVDVIRMYNTVIRMTKVLNNEGINHADVLALGVEMAWENGVNNIEIVADLH